jgi:hypothetical protein
MRHGCLEELENILVWSAVLVEQLDTFNNAESKDSDSSDSDSDCDDSDSDYDSDYEHLNDKRSPNFLSAQDKLGICTQAGLLAKGFYKAETQHRAEHGIPINKQAENKAVSQDRNLFPPLEPRRETDECLQNRTAPRRSTMPSLLSGWPVYQSVRNTTCVSCGETKGLKHGIQPRMPSSSGIWTFCARWIPSTASWGYSSAGFWTTLSGIRRPWVTVRTLLPRSYWNCLS